MQYKQNSTAVIHATLTTFFQSP